MKKCLSNVKVIAGFLNPLVDNGTDVEDQIKAIDELWLLETLRRNKIGLKFRQRIEVDHGLKERVFSAFPRVKAFLNDLYAKQVKDSFAFNQISDFFFKNGIEFLLIKSDGSFPFESDNIDVLIKPKMLRAVSKLLEQTGYVELADTREPHKFLFRKSHENEILPLHIHTRVEWEGTQFIDSRNLWSRRRVSNGGVEFDVPSPEDCVLITLAHLLFENHEMRLVDLLKLSYMMGSYDLDWDYMLNHSRRLYWDGAFHLTMVLANRMYNDLYGAKLLQKNVIIKIQEAANIGFVNLFEKLVRPSRSACLPLKIPYSIAVLYFRRRVLSDSTLSVAQRLIHTMWVASDVLRRKIFLSYDD